MVHVAELRRPPRSFLPISESHVAILGAILVAVSLVVEIPALRLGLLGVGSGLFGAAMIVAGRKFALWRRRQARLACLQDLASAEMVAVAITDHAGRVVAANIAAKSNLGVEQGGLVSTAFSELLATPLPTVRKLLVDAGERGHARLERASHRGLVRVSVIANPDDLFVWRLENLSPRETEIGVGDIGLPMLVATSKGAIIASNHALAKMLVGSVPETLNKLLGKDRPASGDICRLEAPGGPVSMRVHVIEGLVDAGCSEVYFLPADIGGETSTRMLFDTLPVPMIKVAVNGRILACNRGACDLVGLEMSPGSWLSDSVSGLGRPLTDWLQDAHSGVGPSRSEFLQARGNGADRFIQMSLQPVEERGETVLIAVLTDATELKTLEAQFVQSQKMQAIGQLAGGVAHDFNNLLTAISGHCDLLLLRHDEGDPAYADLVQINQNANRAASLVGQLLAFSRKQTLSPETVDLPEALSDLTHLLSRLVGETVRLSVRHEDAVPRIRVDKRQLEQVIMNLVVNARDAMPDGGEILVETASVTLDAEMRRNRAAISPGQYAVVRVSDQGCGIAPENLQKIFEPFYTTKKTGEGTGLGLSTAYGIVKQTGGFIFADSAPGQGTHFTLYFPAHSGEVVPEKPAAPVEHEAQSIRGDGVIMLVEDEAPVRAFASRALRLRGFTVIEAENAEEALARLSDLTLNVDVFVTDVVMPGMDGPSWVREALKDRPGTRVVFVSGYAEDALSDHQSRIPNSVFLPKPFSLQELTTTVQRQFH